LDDRREELLSWGALVAILLMLAGEAALLTTHLWVPLARAMDRVADERDATPAPGADPAAGRGEPAPGRWEVVRYPSPWRWAAYAIIALAAALVLIAMHRRTHDTTEPGRWLWVLLMGGLVVIWGLLTVWLMTRQAFMFEQIIQQPGPPGPQL